MSDKTFKGLSLLHLVVLGIMTAVMAVMTVITFTSLSSIIKEGLFVVRLKFITELLAYIMGFIYALKGYTKKAAVFYKTFLLFLALNAAFTMATSFMNKPYGLGLPLHIVRFICLLGLLTYTDLGKKKTWWLFACLFIVDIILAIVVIAHAKSDTTVYRILISLSRLVMDGTVGLAIMGKYRDKDSRGTV